MQSEIRLMLPTSALGPHSEDREKPYKWTSDLFSSRSKQLAFTEADKVCEPSKKKIFSHLLCVAWRRYETAVCIADSQFVTVRITMEHHTGI